MLPRTLLNAERLLQRYRQAAAPSPSGTSSDSDSDIPDDAVIEFSERDLCPAALSRTATQPLLAARAALPSSLALSPSCSASSSRAEEEPGEGGEPETSRCSLRNSVPGQGQLVPPLSAAPAAVVAATGAPASPATAPQRLAAPSRLHGAGGTQLRAELEEASAATESLYRLLSSPLDDLLSVLSSRRQSQEEAEAGGGWGEGQAQGQQPETWGWQQQRADQPHARPSVGSGSEDGTASGSVSAVGLHGTEGASQRPAMSAGPPPSEEDGCDRSRAVAPLPSPLHDVMTTPPWQRSRAQAHAGPQKDTQPARQPAEPPLQLQRPACALATAAAAEAAPAGGAPAVVIATAEVGVQAGGGVDAGVQAGAPPAPASCARCCATLAPCPCPSCGLAGKRQQGSGCWTVAGGQGRLTSHQACPAAGTRACDPTLSQCQPQPPSTLIVDQRSAATVVHQAAGVLGMLTRAAERHAEQGAERAEFFARLQPRCWEREAIAGQLQENEAARRRLEGLARCVQALRPQYG